MSIIETVLIVIGTLVGIVLVGGLILAGLCALVTSMWSH